MYGLHGICVDLSTELGQFCNYPNSLNISGFLPLTSGNNKGYRSFYWNKQTILVLIQMILAFPIGQYCCQGDSYDCASIR